MAKTVTPKRRTKVTTLQKPGRPSKIDRAIEYGADPSIAAIKPEDLTDFNESFNILIYGDSGVGKTVLAGQAPNAVFLSTEKGTISAKRQGSKAKLFRATDWGKVEAALAYIDAHPDEFDWLIVDSLTKMQVLLIRRILEIEHSKNEVRDLDIPAIQDHQKWQNMFKRFVDRIIEMPINVIFVATAMHKEDPEGDDIVLPDIQGKDYAISSYICAQMDGTYYLYVKTKRSGETVRRLLAQTTPPYFAKDRYDVLGQYVEAPFMPDIIKLLETNPAGKQMATVPATPASAFKVAKASKKKQADDYVFVESNGVVPTDDEDADWDDEEDEEDED